METGARSEPGSFRDPESRVFYVDGEVYRALSTKGWADFQLLAASGLLEDPRIVSTSVAAIVPPTDLLAGEVAGVLQHERVPFVSYPYEWTFSMLKDAALLQLDLLLAALGHDLVLKDATPYNVQFTGSRPLLIDVGSFEQLRESELWVGYRQFCMLVLYPLLLQATKGLSFQQWLRGSVDGIDPVQMRALTSFRDRFRRGYPTHVYLNARLGKHDAGARTHTNARLQRPGVGKQVTLANVRRMRALVAGLIWDPPRGAWVEYGACNSYTEADSRQKDDFVRSVTSSHRWPLVWDLGCNNGRYSRIAAETATQVVAIDADPGPVDLLYRELRAAGETRVLPLTVNLADPSPGLGWRGVERRPLLDRGAPDLVLALALVHHLVIGANIPVRDVVEWLASLGAALVVEIPTREDPMVQKLLSAKRAGLHPDYELGTFETCMREAFDIRRQERLGSGTRVLYFATPRIEGGH